MTETLRKTFDVPFPENGTTDVVIHSLIVTHNNKLVIAQEGEGVGNKIKVVSLDKVDEVKEIDLGVLRIPYDMALLGDGLVAVSCTYSKDILLVDVSGADPVISEAVSSPRSYVESAVAGGSGHELIIAGWTSDAKGHIDVFSREKGVIRNVKENWDQVHPEHAVKNGNDLFITVTDLNNDQPLYRIDLDTGRSIPNIGTLDLSTLAVDTFYQGDVDSAGNLYFPVNGPTCSNAVFEKVKVIFFLQKVKVVANASADLPVAWVTTSSVIVAASTATLEYHKTRKFVVRSLLSQQRHLSETVRQEETIRP
nr:hypothetical protein BaRGS_015751 [Batillaria attramentaria]